MTTGTLVILILGAIFWSTVFFFLSKFTEEAPKLEDAEDYFRVIAPVDPKLNQLIARKYYRGVTRADLEKTADILGIPYSNEDNYVLLKQKVDQYKLGK